MRSRWDRCRSGYRYKRGIIPYDDNEMVDSEKAFVVSIYTLLFLFQLTFPDIIHFKFDFDHSLITMLTNLHEMITK